jgi:hypothetical protein
MTKRHVLLCAAITLAACSHEEPFETPETGSDRPFAPGTPARLTYNPGTDQHPSWADDGKSFFYSAQQYLTPDGDRCIAQLPATGGSAFRTICNPDPAAEDSSDTFDSPSLFGDDRLLFVRTASRPGATAPNTAGVYVGSLSAPLTAARVLPLPYTVPGGRTHGTIAMARWLSRNRVMYLGQSVLYARECNGCALDTLITGLEVVEMDLSGAQPSLAVVPGTYGASSVALSTSRDTLYYTLINDSRVYRLALPSAQITIAHDFGAMGIARDVTVLGARLVAVVGGEVAFIDDPLLGPIQPDGGGALVSVDLTTGAETVLQAQTPLVFRRPEFAPAGSTVRLVAEGYEPGIGPQSRHQLVSRVGELYLFEAP